MEPKPELQMLSEEQIKERIRMAPAMPIVYANHSRIAPSFYDFRLFLGQLNISPTNEQTVEEKICVVFAPECAKAVGEALLKAVSQYETLFGPLRTPPNPPQLQNGQKPRKKKVQ